MRILLQLADRARSWQINGSIGNDAPGPGSYDHHTIKYRNGFRQIVSQLPTFTTGRFGAPEFVVQMAARSPRFDGDRPGLAALLNTAAPQDAQVDPLPRVPATLTSARPGKRCSGLRTRCTRSSLKSVGYACSVSA